uniref:Uncharacterized protein n=1 Tax=Knipowitschia caucasica TaxID=637954 RepID=A0AAV2IYM0_KNICA
MRRRRVCPVRLKAPLSLTLHPEEPPRPTRTRAQDRTPLGQGHWGTWKFKRWIIFPATTGSALRCSTTMTR